MTPRVLLAFCVVLSALATGRAALAGEEAKEEPKLSEQQAKVILDGLQRVEPFLDSHEARLHPESLGHFFTKEDYALLRGNPILGYWHLGTFRWAGTRVAWEGVLPSGASARPITRRAWDAAFDYAAKKQGLVVDPNAPLKIRATCVAAIFDTNPDQPNRGVVLEFRVLSPTGRFLYRFGVGKPTVADAVGASLDTAISLARRLGSSQGGDHDRR